MDVELLPHSLGGGRAGRRPRLGSRVLRQAADAYDRVARPPYGRVPPPTPTGNRLRQAARIMSAFAYLTGDRSMTPIMLIAKLAALAEAVAELRESQRHAVQAAAALLGSSTAVPGSARQHCCPARRAVLPRTSPAGPATIRLRTARP